VNAPLITFATTLIGHHPGVEFRAVGEEIFLVHPDGEKIHNLNSMAAALWRLLAQPMTGQDMAEVVQAAFPVMSATKVKADVETVVSELLAGGFAKIVKKA